MRYGFTTGSCSAAAAKAAAYMLLGGNKKENIEIETPKGILFKTEILDISIEEKRVSCAVRKDGGDDPDVTSGCLVYAEVFAVDDSAVADDSAADSDNADDEKRAGAVLIDGGVGVGRVTLPGLDQPVGNAAINSVPRKMIEKEVREVMELFDYRGSLQVIISIPEGETLAEKTFNPRLGIVGGISVLGTSGIVEPMSVEALLKTIETELRQKRAMGYEQVVIAPGNYGMDFMKTTYHYDLDKAVKCSNYIGATLDMIGELQFKEVLLVGHLGKLVKVSGGIMNTHSHEADSRMELMAAAGIRAGLEAEILSEVLDAVSVDAAYEIIKKTGKEKSVMSHVMKKMDYHLKKRANGRFQIECITFSNAFGKMGETDGADEMLRRIMEE